MHAVSDTIAGPNLRLKDNVIQAAVIGVMLVVGLVVGVLVAPSGQEVAGLVLGGGAGLVVGLFGSGLTIGIYRLVTRVRGA